MGSAVIRLMTLFAFRVYGHSLSYRLRCCLIEKNLCDCSHNLNYPRYRRVRLAILCISTKEIGYCNLPCVSDFFPRITEELLIDKLILQRPDLGPPVQHPANGLALLNR